MKCKALIFHIYFLFIQNSRVGERETETESFHVWFCLSAGFPLENILANLNNKLNLTALFDKRDQLELDGTDFKSASDWVYLSL